MWGGAGERAVSLGPRLGVGSGALGARSAPRPRARVLSDRCSLIDALLRVVVLLSVLPI